MRKNYFKIILVSALFIFVHSACNEDNLDLKPWQETEADFFDEEDDFDRTARGVYAAMTNLYAYQPFNDFSTAHAMRHLPGDDITTLQNEPQEIFQTLQPGEGRVNGVWDILYLMLSRANTLLEKVEEEEGVYTTPGLKAAHEGEALFLRGWVLFRLWNYWGTAPLITERIVTQDNIYNPSSQGTQLLDQAIQDFTDAAELLPASWDDQNRGRATKSSANGFLGKSLVFRASWTDSQSDYQAAIEAFDKINDRQLVADYRDNFYPTTENNEESLFEYQASTPVGNENIWLQNDFNITIGTMSAYWGWFDERGLFGRNPYVASEKFIAAVENTDPRVRYMININDNKIEKYIENDISRPRGIASINNPRILRYADVLLLKAEAIVQSGGDLTEAINIINDIRERARNSGDSPSVVPADRSTSVTDQAVVMDWIMYERMVELFGEEAHRWFDLRRWHVQGEIDLSNFNFSSLRDDFEFDVNTHLYYPIPNSETDLNSQVTQNPGY